MCEEKKDQDFDVYPTLCCASFVTNLSRPIIQLHRPGYKNANAVSSLILWGAEIDSIGITNPENIHLNDIYEAIQQSKSETKLDLNAGCLVRNIKPITSLLRTDALVAMTINYCMLDQGDISKIANAVVKSGCLAALSMYGCRLLDTNARMITCAISCNRSLVSLTISENQIADEGAKFLAKLISKNHRLTKLYMMDCEIGPTGAKEIARALEWNRSLRTLRLRDNAISDVGAKALAEALRKNVALVRLDLRHCGIANEGGYAIADALRCNCTLHLLKLAKNNKISLAVAKLIRAASRAIIDIPISKAKHR